MATSCANVVLGSLGYGFPSAPASNGRPQPCSPTLCRSSQRRWGGTISTGEPGSHRRRSSWSQRTRTNSPFCLPTGVSSDASAPTELNAGEGSESGMSIEEKNAILAFEAGGLDPGGADSDAEGRNSSEYVQLSSSAEEGDKAALQAVKEREQEVAELRRRASKAVKGQGLGLANVVTMFMSLLDRPSPGDRRMIAGAGRAVIERVEEEVAKLQGVEGVDGQSLFEILRLLKLLQMDVQLIAAARKDSTLSERLVQAKAHCRQFLNILSML